MMDKEVSAVILAGGASKRMGHKNKAFLKLGNKPVIEWLLEALQKAFNDIYIVTDTPEQYEEYTMVKTTGDKIIRPERSTLAGIHAGIHEVNSKYGFVVACDMPFINTDLINEIIKIRNGYDVIIPCYRGHVEPTFALYHKNCLPYIERNLLNDNFRITGFFPDVKVKYLGEEFTKKFDPEFKSFLNINTPEELHKATKLIKKRH